MPPSDETLIHRFQRGEAEAFDLLAQRWQRRVHEIAVRLLGDGDEAKDAQQAVLFRTFASLSGFDGRSRFSTWIYRVVVNQCRDRLRRKRRRPEIPLDEHDPESRRETSTAEECSRRETARLVSDAIAALPDDERDIVILKHYADLSFNEIGEVLGVPTSTVKSRMARGLEKLRLRLNSFAENQG